MPVHSEDLEYLRPQSGAPLLARFYRPEGAGPFPAVLEVHGGAWTSGDRLNNVAIGDYLAARGIVMLSIDFRMPPAVRSGETVYSMLVADGMGGDAAGEVASRNAISFLVDLVLETPDWILRLNDGLMEKVSQRMERRFQQVQEDLTDQAQEDPALFGMGTTLTVTCSLGADLLLFHVGDARAYLFRQDRLHRLTCDHTNVADLSPLKGMKLKFLDCDQTLVSDLAPLRGMALEGLSVAYCRGVTDLSPLKGMPLQFLWWIGTAVSDTSPLEGMPLKEILCDFQRERDAEFLRSFKSLETINHKSAAEFWKEVDGK